jgi:hypothetical protein
MQYVTNAGKHGVGETLKNAFANKSVAEIVAGNAYMIRDGLLQNK